MDKKLFTLREQKNRDCMIVYASALQLDPEKPIDVIFQPHKKNRSLAQNNLMWDWITKIADYLDVETGIMIKPIDLKEEFQERFLGKKSFVRSDGTIGERTIGTSELNTAKFTEFLKRIDVYAASELYLQLPHPADLYYEAMAMGK